MIHEPMTVVTDYLLAALAFTFAVRLWARSRPWALAFTFTGIAALAGGTHHGIAPYLLPLAASILWKITTLSVGFGGTSLLIGTSRKLVPLAIAKCAVYSIWMLTHDDFIYVIVDYGMTLLIVGAVEAARWMRTRASSAPWILGSIAVSAVAAAVQASGFVLHRHFNHNDLYHVIQMLALWLLYRGGILMTSATDRSTIRPR